MSYMHYLGFYVYLNSSFLRRKSIANYLEKINLKEINETLFVTRN